MQTSISEQAIRDKARALGFAEARFTGAQAGPELLAKLTRFVELGHHGDMGWMAERMQARANPASLWPQARSAIALAMPYDGPGENETGPLIAAYARGRDYHDVVKGKLKELAQFIHRASQGQVKVFVDTAPVMEKPLAMRAGLGWQGKHSNLVSRRIGNWFFLGVILTEFAFTPDEAEVDHCGNCRACLDACPTQAFPAPYQLDARRCISYLTIEHKGHIPREFRKPMGQRIFGCDDCLAACPWNKFAVEARERKFAHRETANLAQLLKLDDTAFRHMFAGSPVKRTGRDRFLRNVLIAAGNSGDVSLLTEILRLLDDPSALVRAMAFWAARQLGANPPRSPSETDEGVRAEWDL